LTVISTALRDRAIKLGVPAEKIRMITGGAPLDEFQDHTIVESREHVGLQGDDLIIGYSSKDGHYEIEMMIRALAEVVKKYPKAKLLLTGTTGDLATKLSTKYGVTENLILTGVLPYKELPWYLGCANVFILPFPDKIFNRGRWPNKIGDYFSLARPLVSNPCGDVKRILEENEVGLLADWDPIDFARKIIFLFENKDISLRMGKNGRQYAERYLDWNFLTEKLEEFYYLLLEEKKQVVKENGSNSRFLA